MDNEDELVSTGLDIIADCTTGYEPTDKDAFEWKFSNQTKNEAGVVLDTAPVQILQDLKDRLQLGSESWQLTRNFVQHGAEFREIVLDENGIVQRFKYLPSYTIWPNFDNLGNRVAGWEQRSPSDKPGSGVAFAQWQIVPFIYGSNKSYFGTGLMKPARRTYARLQKLEDGMVIARSIRAYDKVKHKIPVKPEWSLPEQMRAIEEYKKTMTKRKIVGSDGSMRFVDNPLEVGTDFYLPDDGTNRGDVEIMHSRNVQLSNIEDVLYHRDRMLSRLKVPRHYLNLGSGNKGALTDGGTSAEDIQFARTLRQTQAVLRLGLNELAAFALFMQGYDAGQLGLTMFMSEVNNQQFLQDSQMRLNLAHAAEIFAALFGGLPTEIIATEYMRLGSEDQDILTAFIKQAEEQHSEEMAVHVVTDGIGGVVLGTVAKNTPNPTAASLTGQPSNNSSGKNRNGTITRMDRGGSAASGGKGASQAVKSSPSLQDASLKDTANALTNLLMLVQNAREKYGDSFQLGTAERRQQVETTMVDIGLADLDLYEFMNSNRETNGVH